MPTRINYDEVQAENKHARFMFNLKKYWLVHQEVIDALESNGQLDDELREKYLTNYIAIISSYASAAHSYELSHAWNTKKAQGYKKEIEEQMNHFRKNKLILPPKMNEDI
jgi:hypothetical protein